MTKNNHTIQFIDLQSEHLKIEQELNLAFNETLRDGAFINGPAVKEFSLSLAQWIGQDYVIPCANGTDALLLAYMSLGLKPGDEIILPSFNYVSSAEAAALLGITPVFAEVSPHSYGIDPSEVEKLITTNTKAIVAVHLFGNACDMTSLLKITQKHNLYLIEDNAQALGTRVKVNGKWKFTGTIGDVGTNSFFPTKNLGCMGDGGALTTSSSSLQKKLSSLASHGQYEKYKYDLVGLNSRLDALQAKLLSIKLPLLQHTLKRRRALAKIYMEEWSQLDNVTLPSISPTCEHSFNQFTIRIKNRDHVKNNLKELGIPSMIYYPSPLHLQNPYKHFNHSDLYITEQLCNEVLSIPIHPMLSESEQAYIIESLKKIVN